MAIGIQATQDPTTGLWFQVVDKAGSAGNYLETSGSTMFVYALKTGVNYGWINSSYSTVAQAGWQGLIDNNKITTLASPVVNDFAPAMGVQTDYAAYVGITSVDCPGSAHPHGYAAILMAGSVMEFPFSLMPIRFSTFTASKKDKAVLLKWQNFDNDEAASFIVERSENGANFSAVGTVPPNKSANYNWTDNSASGNINYYRIKANASDGTIYYSTVVAVRWSNVEISMSVSPNPVKNGSMNVLFENIKTGKYSLYIVNNCGEIIVAKSFNAKEGRLAKALSLPPGIQKGMYCVQLKGGNEIAMSKLVLVE